MLSKRRRRQQQAGKLIVERDRERMKAKERERMDVMYLMGLKEWQRCIECEWRSSASDVRIRPNIGANARIRKTSISIVYWTCEWNLRFSMMPRKFRIKPENHLASFIRLLCAIWECVFGSYKCAQCIRPYRVRRLYGSWEVQPVSIEIRRMACLFYDA